jgi:hypothetical protein
MTGAGADKTPEQYEANVARMAANRQTAFTPGAPRKGSALLSGLLRCGLCGEHHMSVRYHDGRGSAHGYVCAFYQVNYRTGGPCQHRPSPGRGVVRPAVRRQMDELDTAL